MAEETQEENPTDVVEETPETPKEE